MDYDSGEYSNDYVSMPTPREMGRMSYALAHAELFDKYIALRVRGIPENESFLKTFPEEWFDNSNGFDRVRNVENNPYTSERIRAKIAAMDVNEIWNPQISIYEMISLVRDKKVKDGTRLAAIKELNVILNITVVDELGKTKIGRRLQDFYKDIGFTKHTLTLPSEENATEETN